MKLFSRNFSNVFKSAVYGIPGPEKINKLGEDAYYMSKEVIAIADGVGGWSTQGIDSSKYSWELMNNVGKSYTELHENLKYNVRDLLNKAAKSCKETGSSTCAIVVLDQEKPKVHTANIGDSGFLIFRKANNEINLVGKSKETTHEFNFPFQLGTGGDNPNTASFEDFDVLDKDLVVMFTDGVGDNVFEEQIMEIVKTYMLVANEVNLEEFSERLAKTAHQNSLDRAFKSPFMTNALKHRLRWYGGKPDDITVVCGQIFFEK